MNSQTVTVNLIPGLSTPAVVRVSQYDVGRPLAFKVLDGTNVASLGAMVTTTIVGTKPSGLGFSVVGTLDGNIVTLDTTLAMTQECGMIPAEISFTHTGVVIGTANFILSVEPSPHPEGTTDGTQESMGNLETRLQSQINTLDSRVDALEAGQSGGSGLTDDIKTALLQIAQKVAYIDAHGQDYYDDLYDALYNDTTRSVLLMLSHVSSSNSQSSVEVGDSYTTTLTASTNYTLNTVSVTMGGVDVTATVYSSGTISIPSVTGNIVITATAVLAAQSITATYTQSGTVYDTASLDSLKTDLVVTANYAGGTSETVPASDYTLSGTLTVGTSTITVSYAGLTTTFTVTVTTKLLYSWDFTSGLIDTEQSLEATTNATQSSSGITFSSVGQYVGLTGVYNTDKTYVMDIGTFAKQNPNNYGRLWMVDTDTNTSSGGQGYIATGTGKGGDMFYIGAWETSNIIVSNSIDSNGSYYANSTVAFYVDSSGYVSVYKNGTLLGTSSTVISKSAGSNVYIGSSGTGDYLYDLVVTGYRIYEGAIY